jgi:hypothetical protein
MFEHNCGYFEQSILWHSLHYPQVTIRADILDRQSPEEATVNTFKEQGSLRTFMVAVVMMFLAVIAWPTAAGAASTTTFTITNGGETEIYYVYIRPGWSSNWGKDMLGSSTTIPSGDMWSTRLTQGTYDMLAIDSEGVTVGELADVVIGEPYNWQIGNGSEVQVTLINAGEETICYLYVSPSSAVEWGEDRLGSSVLNPDDSWELSLEPDSYDFRMEGCGGEVLDQAYGFEIYEDVVLTTP